MADKIIVISFFLTIGIISWTLCSAAGISDELIEAMFDKNKNKNEDKNHE